MAGSPTHPFPFKALEALHLPRDGGLLADVGERQWMRPATMHAQPLAHTRMTRVSLPIACVMPYRRAARVFPCTPTAAAARNNGTSFTLLAKRATRAAYKQAL